MKTKNLLILICFAYLIYSCEDNFLQVDEMLPEETPLKNTYPKKYVFNELTYNPTEFFEYREDSFKQIFPESGDLTGVDSVLKTEYYDIEEFPFKEIEFLSDSLVRMKIESQELELNIDTTFAYELTEEKIRFIGLGELYWLPDTNQFTYCSQSYSYNYFNSSKNKRTYYHLDIGDCVSLDKMEILNSIITNESNTGNGNLQYLDTIILNISYYNLDLVE